MIRAVFYFSILILVFSCKRGEQKYDAGAIYKVNLREDKAPKGIRFAVKTKRLNSYIGDIEVNATLYNDNPYAVYFLSSTCEGEQYSLRYDTAKFTLWPRIMCNGSYPQVDTITANGKFEFKTYFRWNRPETKIKLGFDYYSLYQPFDLSDKNISAIYNRPLNKQTIVWAETADI